VYNVLAYLGGELIQKETRHADSPETAIEVVKEVLHGNGFTNTADFTFEVVPVGEEMFGLL